MSDKTILCLLALMIFASLFLKTFLEQQDFGDYGGLLYNYKYWHEQNHTKLVMSEAFSMPAIMLNSLSVPFHSFGPPAIRALTLAYSIIAVILACALLNRKDKLWLFIPFFLFCIARPTTRGLEPLRVIFVITTLFFMLYEKKPVFTGIAAGIMILNKLPDAALLLAYAIYLCYKREHKRLLRTIIPAIIIVLIIVCLTNLFTGKDYVRGAWINHFGGDYHEFDWVKARNIVLHNAYAIILFFGIILKHFRENKQRFLNKEMSFHELGPIMTPLLFFVCPAGLPYCLSSSLIILFSALILKPSNKFIMLVLGAQLVFGIGDYVYNQNRIDSVFVRAREQNQEVMSLLGNASGLVVFPNTMAYWTGLVVVPGTEGDYEKEYLSRNDPGELISLFKRGNASMLFLEQNVFENLFIEFSDYSLPEYEILGGFTYIAFDSGCKGCVDKLIVLNHTGH